MVLADKKLGAILPVSTYDAGRFKILVYKDKIRVQPKFSFHYDRSKDKAPPPVTTNWLAKCQAAIAQIYNNSQKGDCLPPGTRVRMANGTTKKIEDVKVTEQVMTAEGNTGPVKAVMVRYENSELVRIRMYGHQHLRMTGNHPLLTRRGYVPSGEIQKGDWIACPVRAIGKRQHIKTAAYLTDDVLYGVQRKSKRQLIGSSLGAYNGSVAAQRNRIAEALEILPSQIALNEKFGRLIGLFLSEGSTNENIVCWTFSHDERETLVAETVSLLTEFGFKSSLSIRKSAIYVRVCNKVLLALLRSLCGVGAAGKRMHADLMDGPAEFLESVLSAWLDGDGHEYRKNRYEGTTISHELAMNMSDIAQSLGYSVTVNGRQPSSSRAPNGPNGELIEVNASYRWDVKVWKYEDEKIKVDEQSTSQFRGVHWCKYNNKWVADGSTPEGKSKNLGLFDSEQEAAEAAKAYRIENGKFGNGRNFKEGDVVWRRVRETKREPYSGNVFNIEVTGDNSYVAEGIGVHNCVIASALHRIGGWTGNETGTPAIGSNAQAVKWYEKICGPGDQGCVITDVLQYMQQHGIPCGPARHRIAGFVSVDNTNQNEVQVCAEVFGPAQNIGINLPSAWYNNANGNGFVWNNISGNLNIVGGHDVAIIDVSAQGVVIATWGMYGTITWEALANNNIVTEMHCSLSPDWYSQDNLAPNGINNVTLQQDLVLVGQGTIPPLPAPSLKA